MLEFIINHYYLIPIIIAISLEPIIFALLWTKLYLIDNISPKSAKYTIINYMTSILMIGAVISAALFSVYVLQTIIR